MEPCFALPDKRSKQLKSLWASVGRRGGTTPHLTTTATWPKTHRMRGGTLGLPRQRGERRLGDPNEQ